MGMFINVLNLTTDTLLYIVMASILVGMILFSYSKSVRDQELGESLIYGAVIAGVVLLALTPTFNTITWIFTGDGQRAPLADPQLEAEPPTYYSTEFQDGTQNGWEQNNPSRYNAPGNVRPVSAGEGFDLRLQSGTSGEIAAKHSEHISLADQLSTGFVGVTASTKSKTGYTSDPHQSLMQVRVYLTEDDSEPYWIDGTNYYSSGSNSYNYESMMDDYGITDSNGNFQGDNDDRHDLVAAETLAKSFDGQRAQIEDIVQYNLSRPYIHTEVVVFNNRGDAAAQGKIQKVRVGATTSAGHT